MSAENLARPVGEEYIRCTVKTAVATCLLAVLLMASTACRGDGNSAGDHAVFRGHGVSFNYPRRWKKAEDETAPISDVWILILALDKERVVQVEGAGKSELEYPAANLAANEAFIKQQQGLFGAHFQAGSEKLTVDGRPGVRFRARQSRDGVTSQTTMILTFKGKTQYLFTCTHQERAEIERGCAQIVRTFKVRKP